jgi:hypothetical protein
LTEITSIEVREGWKWFYLLLILAWAAFLSIGFIIPEQRKETVDFFFGKWNFGKLPMFLMLTAWISLSIFYYFDKRVKVRIDSDGIWSKKNGLVSWNDIWYFSSTGYKTQYDGDLFKLRIKLKDTEERLDKEEILKFQRMDKKFDEIRPIVEYYAAKYQIQDLGQENEP